MVLVVLTVVDVSSGHVAFNLVDLHVQCIVLWIISGGGPQGITILGGSGALEFNRRAIDLVVHIREQDRLLASGLINVQDLIKVTVVDNSQAVSLSGWIIDHVGSKWLLNTEGSSELLDLERLRSSTFFEVGLDQVRDVGDRIIKNTLQDVVFNDVSIGHGHTDSLTGGLDVSDLLVGLVD